MWRSCFRSATSKKIKEARASFSRRQAGCEVMATCRPVFVDAGDGSHSSPGGVRPPRVFSPLQPLPRHGHNHPDLEITDAGHLVSDAQATTMPKT